MAGTMARATAMAGTMVKAALGAIVVADRWAMGTRALARWQAGGLVVADGCPTTAPVAGTA